ncbi:biopolymer transport protein ExbD [Oikeobacillus pervagus]|uniref:Biopolymer transport protein ExbD n=1 Tax=Oikeobacillus pervagus TaxID=1325931 RepID=A0AAJ1WJH9_9BACI|nr:YwmB family TATA-box binding protein [Oikeobacillus pervagus]MDQ0214126.1 biopolymer transport protein ExbD [Oikeobacillus pervagus]
MKQIKISIALLIFIIFIIGDTTIAKKNEMDLLKIATQVKKNNGEITEWSIHTRETVNRDNVEQTVHQLKNRFSHWTWSENIVEERKVFIGTNQQSQIQQSIKVISTTHQPEQSFIIYTVNGKDHEGAMIHFLTEQFQPNYSRIFNNNPIIFSCIKGNFDGKLKEVLPKQINSIMADLQAVEMEKVKEKDFYSISAYSKEMMTDIPLETEQMNLQIGLRQNRLGQKTAFVIGTPIITVEY